VRCCGGIGCLGGGAATLGILGGGGFGVRGDVICGGGVGCAVALGDGAPAEFFSGVFCFGGIIIGMPIIIGLPPGAPPPLLPLSFVKIGCDLSFVWAFFSPPFLKFEMDDRRAFRSPVGSGVS
jgi:hypothetical protein